MPSRPPESQENVVRIDLATQIAVRAAFRWRQWVRNFVPRGQRNLFQTGPAGERESHADAFRAIRSKLSSSNRVSIPAPENQRTSFDSFSWRRITWASETSSRKRMS